MNEKVDVEKVKAQMPGDGTSADTVFRKAFYNKTSNTNPALRQTSFETVWNQLSIASKLPDGARGIAQGVTIEDWEAFVCFHVLDDQGAYKQGDKFVQKGSKLFPNTTYGKLFEIAYLMNSAKGFGKYSDTDNVKLSIRDIVKRCQRQ